jgi:hypothetical protein
VALPPDERDRFRQWLEDNTVLARRSVTDVVSRASRVVSMVDPLQPKTKEELAYRLSEVPEYRRCPPAVRSQLKRAAMLFRSFHGLSTETRL